MDSQDDNLDHIIADQPWWLQDEDLNSQWDFSYVVPLSQNSAKDLRGEDLCGPHFQPLGAEPRQVYQGQVQGFHTLDPPAQCSLKDTSETVPPFLSDVSFSSEAPFSGEESLPFEAPFIPETFFSSEAPILSEVPTTLSSHGRDTALAGLEYDDMSWLDRGDGSLGQFNPTPPSSLGELGSGAPYMPPSSGTLSVGAGSGLALPIQPAPHHHQVSVQPQPKPFTCSHPGCNSRGFKRTYELQRHMKKHSRSQLFPCPVGGCRFQANTGASRATVTQASAQSNAAATAASMAYNVTTQYPS